MDRISSKHCSGRTGEQHTRVKICIIRHCHAQLTMYCTKPFLYAIINVSRLLFSQCYFTKCIGYNTVCVSAVRKSKQMGTNIVGIVINALRKEMLRRHNVVHS